MTLTLASSLDRLRIFLADITPASFTDDELTEGLRLAKSDYDQVRPRCLDTVITLPGAGFEIALNALTDLSAVSSVYYPFNSLLALTDQDPNLTKSFELLFDDGQPLLIITTTNDEEPAAGEEIRIFYTTPNYIDGLDGAAGTTIRASDEVMLLRGAAAYAVVNRAFVIANALGRPTEAAKFLLEWGGYHMTAFQNSLHLIAKPLPSIPFASWDNI